jgi:hypothetical protein
MVSALFGGEQMRDVFLVVAFILHLAAWVCVVVFAIGGRFDLATFALANAIYFRLVMFDKPRKEQNRNG